MPYQDPNTLPTDANPVILKPTQNLDGSQLPQTVEQAQVMLDELTMIRMGMEEMVGLSLELEMANPAFGSTVQTRFKKPKL